MVKFLFVAGINTLFGYSIYALILFLLKNVYASIVLSNIIAILFNFKTYGAIVFKSHDNSKIFRFFAVYLFAMCFQMGFMKVLNMAGVTNSYLAGAIITLPSAGLSFLLMRRFVYIRKVSEGNLTTASEIK